MSYDFRIFRGPQKQPPSRSEEGDFICESLGAARDIRLRISHSLPEVDWSDPAWGVLDCGEHLIEFNVGIRDDLESLLVHTHDPEQAIAFLAELCARNDWSLYDPQADQMVEWTVIQNPEH